MLTVRKEYGIEQSGGEYGCLVAVDRTMDNGHF